MLTYFEISTYLLPFTGILYSEICCEQCELAGRFSKRLSNITHGEVWQVQPQSKLFPHAAHNTDEITTGHEKYQRKDSTILKIVQQTLKET